MKPPNRIVIGLASILLALISLAPFVYLTFRLWLKEPQVWPDEVIFADMAKHAWETGFPATKLFGDTIPGIQTHSFLHPPVFFWLLGAWTSAFGQTIDAVRMFPAIVTVLTLSIAFYFLWWWKKSLLLATLGTLMFSVNSLVSRSGRITRMEILVWMFQLVALWCALAYERTNKRGFLVASALVCGVAILTHPMGVLLPFILGCFWMLSRKTSRWSTIRLFGGILSIPLILYIMYVIPYMNTFITQMYFQLSIKVSLPSYYIFIVRQSPVFQVWTGINILMLMLYIFTTKHEINRQKYLFWIAPILSTIAVIAAKENYFIYLEPWSTCILLLLVSTPAKRWIRILGWLGIVIVVTVQLIINADFVYTYGSMHQSYEGFGNRISSHIPKDATVTTLVIPDPTFILARRKDLTIRRFPTGDIPIDSLTTFMDETDVLIVNTTPAGSDQFLQEYFDSHPHTRKTIQQPGGYQTELIYFSGR